MQRSWLRWNQALLLSLALVCGCAPAQAPGTATEPSTEPSTEPAAAPEELAANDAAALIDLWVSFYIGDAKVGYAHAEARPAEREGRELIRLVETHWNRTGSTLQGHIFATQSTLVIWMDPETLAVVAMDNSVKEKEVETRTTVRASADGATISVEETRLSDGELVGVPQRRSFKVPPGVVGSNDLLMKQLQDAGKLVAGFEHTFYELDLSVPEAREKTLVVRSAEEGVGVQVAFDDVALLLGADGFLIEGYYGDLRIRAEPRSVAQEWGDKIFSANDRLNLDYLVPALPSVEAVVVDIDVQGDPRGDVFAESEYQKVLEVERGDKSTSYRLALTPYRVRPAEELAYPLEFSEAERAELGQYLGSDSLVQSDAPLIVETAKEVTARARSAYEAVALLQEFVSGRLMQTYTAVASLSAVETLEQSQGDCAEHAVLFCALARAAGLPTRRCSGYVFWGQRGGRHAWNQVKLGDQWVHVDCVGDLLAAGPQYILFDRDSVDGSSDRDVGKRLHVLSTCKTKVSVNGFMRDGRVIDLNARSKGGNYFDEKGYRHPFSGLEVAAVLGLEFTEGGNAFQPRVSLDGPGYSVVIRLQSSRATTAWRPQAGSAAAAATPPGGGAKAAAQGAAAAQEEAVKKPDRAPLLGVEPRTIAGLEAVGQLDSRDEAPVEVWIAQGDGVQRLVVEITGEPEDPAAATILLEKLLAGVTIR